MLVMSTLLAVVSVVSSYYWWTIDWWRPPTITGTKVGIEDILLGFVVGGIMSTTYECLFRKSYWKKRLHHHTGDGILLLLLLANITAAGIYAFNLTTFWASTMALLVATAVLYKFRRDLIVNGILTGGLAVLVSSAFYAMIILMNPSWIEATYLPALSGITIGYIPIEEFVFWFLAGLFFGPFYEYWQGLKLKNLQTSSKRHS